MMAFAAHQFNSLYLGGTVKLRLLFSGLKMMVNTLLASMKMLWDVLILTMFFICIFALVGMQVFVGVLRNKCTEPGPENLQISYKDYASNPSEYFVSTIS